MKNKIRIFVVVLLDIFLFISCNYTENSKLIDISIDSGWKFKSLTDSVWYNAVVPGDVYSDLLNNHLIEEPYYRMNDELLSKYEMTEWEYLTHFSLNQSLFDQDEIELQFDGLDTYTDVYLNDSLVLKTNNMFRTWKLSCKKKLYRQNNSLKIVFHSSVEIGLQKSKLLPYFLPSLDEQATVGEQSSPYTRKASFQFGFDAGPRIVNAGIWKTIHLIGWSNAKINNVYLHPVSIQTSHASYIAECTLTSKTDNQLISLELYLNKKKVNTVNPLKLKKGTNQVHLTLDISNPKLWWTNNLGNPYLYEVSIKLKSNNILLDKKVIHLGIKKLELIQKTDSTGKTFYFTLNGFPLFIKGANYVPTDEILSRDKAFNIKQLIEDVVSCNMNMIRVWGGGIYENDSFYDYCDSLGILVWQDFMFSSAMQPGDSLHMNNIREEAIDNVKRLRNHSCIALFCGNSEILVNWENIWKTSYKQNIANLIESQNSTIFNKVLPEVVNKYAPNVEYKESSPAAWNGQLPDTCSGDEHDWSVWYNNADFSDYKYNIGRFVTEYGLQSYPTIKTLKKYSLPEDLDEHSEVIDWKQRNNVEVSGKMISGNELILNYINKYYKQPENFSRLVFLSQINQATCLKTAIESHRINRPYTMGSIFWQLNDCWPGITWSVIDYCHQLKPAAYAVQKAFAPISIIPEEKNGKINIYGVNDIQNKVEAILLVKLIDFYGKALYVNQIPVNLLPNRTSSLLALNVADVLSKYQQEKCCLLVQLNQPNQTLAQNILYFSNPKNLILPIAKIDISVKEAVKGFNIVLRSNLFVRDFWMETVKNKCVFSENYFDLLPGKRYRINVQYNGTKEELEHDLKVQHL